MVAEGSKIFMVYNVIGVGQIIDGPLIVNELISWSKKHKSKLMIFKVDFEKAFDSIHWNTLDNVIIRMGIGFIWRNWIKGCFNSTTSSVLINGSPSMEFSPERGLRQGDPLSPFLFLVVAEALHVVMEEAIEKNDFRGIRVAQNRNTICHLQFADDFVFVDKGALWNSVIVIIHGYLVGTNPHDYESTNNGCWKSIVKAGLEIFNTGFHLFEAFSRKECCLSDRCGSDDDNFKWKWDWRRPIRNGREMAEFNELIELLVLNSRRALLLWKLSISSKTLARKRRGVKKVLLIGVYGFLVLWTHVMFLVLELEQVVTTPGNAKALWDHLKDIFHDNKYAHAIKLDNEICSFKIGKMSVNEYCTKIKSMASRLKNLDCEHKFHSDGTLSRYKARLVANDSSQQLGVDFDETFSPLVKLATIRTVFSLPVSLIFVWSKASTSCLFQRFAGYATRIGFSHSRYESSLFIYTQGSQVAYLLIYVDDIILTTSSTAILQQIIDSLHKEFDMTDLGVLKLGGAGYRVLARLDHRRYSRLVVMGLKLLSPSYPLDFWLGYTDADWAGCPSSHRSTSGYCVFLGDNLLGVYMSANPVQHQRTKHIEIDIYFVRDMITAGDVRVLHVPSRF
nr:hypothetical protein [Tanacetum cinerariifolium]